MFQHTVHILLATRNGGRHLTDQLASIARQTHSGWTLTVSDDGSTDDTLAIVERFARQVPQRVDLLQGPRRGSSTENFFHLIQQAPTDSPADLYAFCDQDDVWLEDKLARAAKWHAQHAQSSVRLYCGRTQIVNEQLRHQALSPAIRRPPGFGNALLENIASGNTMVLSQAVLLAQRRVHPDHSVWHDWTTYLVASALGGQIGFDNVPCLLYRQHGHNVIGANQGVRALLMQVPALVKGRYRRRAELTAKAIADIHELMKPEQAAIFGQFQDMLSATSGVRQLASFAQSGIRRQKHSANLVLAVALLLGMFKAVPAESGPSSTI